MGQTVFLRNLSFDTTEKDVVDRYDSNIGHDILTFLI